MREATFVRTTFKIRRPERGREREREMEREGDGERERQREREKEIDGSICNLS